MDYLDAMAEPITAALAGRPLSVIRVLRGQSPFMQKDVPGYAPPWIRTVSQRTQGSGREVRYALCDDRRTLLWFANQRAVEYHAALVRAGNWDSPTHLVLDIDPPPEADAFGLAVRASLLARQALADAGLATTAFIIEDRGGKVFIDSTRAGGATVAAVYSPRARPGVPVSFSRALG